MLNKNEIKLKPVWKLSVRNTCKKDPIAPTQKNKGITLIALIITIIVMLILVGVTVRVAINGGLFSKAKQAAEDTIKAADLETLQVAVIGAMNESMEILTAQEIIDNLPDGWEVTGADGGPYKATSPEGNVFTVNKKGEIVEGEIDEEEPKPPVTLPEGWTETEKPSGWTNDKVIAVTDGENIVPLPEGFEISTVDGEHTIDEGLVITDGTNEFVWIPYLDTYTEDSLGPLTGTDSTSKNVYDSQEQLDYYYGEGYFDYNNDFNYAEDKTNIENSINKYDGFYVGRYETTIDENGNIGSMRNQKVLVPGRALVQTNNKSCRWYGMYKVQKDMYAGNEAVFSTMITSKEWNIILTFTGYDTATRKADTYTTKPDLSGSAYSTDSSKYDVSKNIYDLAGNVMEWTLTGSDSYGRVIRGESFFNSGDLASYSGESSPDNIPPIAFFGTRAVLCIR